MKINKIFKIIFILIVITIILLSQISRVFAASTYNQKIISAQAIRNNGINNFPESYKKLLQKLVDKTGYTNWKFKAFYTDIDWNELVVAENVHLKNTIIKDENNIYPDTWYCTCNQEGDKNYYCASKEILEYYLDPRNFLTEVTIFQFLDLSNNTDISVSKIENLVYGTFLDGQTDTGIRYAKAIKDASVASGESPYSIVIKIFQELGKLPKGEKPYIISGQDTNYPNVYNFYNYGAYDGEDNTKQALEYAYNAGWDTEYKAIVEGAKLLSSSYLGKGQNTKYTYKFDIIGTTKNELYTNQYMTNIQDPTTQSAMLYEAYEDNGYLDNELTFIIPIYKNMPTYVKLPSEQAGNLYYISSNYTSVYLRSGPGGSSSGYTNIAALPKDTIVNVLQIDTNGWAKVEVDGLIGYVSSQYITKVNTIEDIYKIPTDSDLPFEDIDADEWYYSAIKYNYENEIILGTSNEEFSPETNLTRAMLVTILHRMEGSPYASGTSKFPDVQDTRAYYYVAVKWATQNNIVSGYDNGKFGPNDPITREQLAVILNKYCSYKGKYKAVSADFTKFKDANKISNWAKWGMNWAVGSGVITGNATEGTLNPQGTATRAESASMLYKYCTKIK